MTPIELRRSSDRAVATLQAMRDVADMADGRLVAAYDGPDPEQYRRIFDEWIGDLTAPEVRPPIVGIARARP